MTERAALRQILRNIVELSKETDKSSLSKISKLIASVSVSVLEIKLPQVDAIRPQNIYSSDVYEAFNISCSIFGIQKQNGSIPLHDHNNCFGFIRVLRGSLKVRSYSLLNKQKEHELIDGLMSNTKDFNNNMRPVIYEGEQFADADDASVLVLDPQQSNIHEVTATVDGTAFFDILIPGYKSPCLYYAPVSNNSNELKAGDICWLKVIDMPSDYYTDYCPYKRLTSL